MLSNTSVQHAAPPRPLPQSQLHAPPSLPHLELRAAAALHVHVQIDQQLGQQHCTLQRQVLAHAQRAALRLIWEQR